jgi:hypothetical protein
LAMERKHRYGWGMWFAGLWGGVMTTVMLSISFVLLAPFTLIRLKDPLRRRLGGEDSYWEDRPTYEATIEDMRRAF